MSSATSAAPRAPKEVARAPQSQPPPPTTTTNLDYTRLGSEKGEREGEKGSRRQANFLFAPDVLAVLATIPRGTRTAWVEDAIRHKAGLVGLTKAALAQELARAEQEEREAAARKTVIRARLEQYDADQVGDNETRAKVLLYLQNSPSATKQTWARWAEARGIPMAVFEHIARAHLEAQGG
jgi:hypothetical protein